MDGAQLMIEGQEALFDEYDAALADLEASKNAWVQLPPADRIALLSGMKDGIMKVAEGWAETSARKKGLVVGTAIAGEEWLAGPYATIAGVNALMVTLSQMKDKSFIDHLPQRELPTGQLGVKVMPHSIWDRLLLSGVTAEVWMQKGVNAGNLKKHAAVAYDVPAHKRAGKVALVLGAGNVAAITPLDVLQKLMIEDQVVILKMNPINDYLTDFYKIAMKPFIDGGFLRIVKGDAKGGAYLCDHPIIEELHITGSQFQAENIATMKLHNSGHNCVAMQTMIMPKGWAKAPALMNKLKAVIASSTRPTWYPGAVQRMDNYATNGGKVETIDRGPVAPPVVIGEVSEDTYNRACEVFGPALGVKELEAESAEGYLIAAIEYANTELWGTLGANIVIHPKTIRQIGKTRFDEIIAELKYGSIAINTWTGLAFLAAACPWGAYPGHTLDNVGSGIGTVHNSFMLEKTEKVVIQAPWRPFPRGLLSGQFTLLPKPPFFITNKKQHKVGRLLTYFQYKPSWFKLPRIFLNALLG